MDFRGKRKVVFIVNPISGLNKVLPKRALIDAFIDKKLFDYDIVMTEYPRHATEIARRASADGADIVVAVGGDGTVNEVGCGLKQCRSKNSIDCDAINLHTVQRTVVAGGHQGNAVTAFAKAN